MLTLDEKKFAITTENGGVIAVYMKEEDARTDGTYLAEKNVGTVIQLRELTDSTPDGDVIKKLYVVKETYPVPKEEGEGEKGETAEGEKKEEAPAEEKKEEVLEVEKKEDAPAEEKKEEDGDNPSGVGMGDACPNCGGEVPQGSNICPDCKSGMS